MKNFNIGDKVQFLDGNLKCTIISLTEYKAIVLDEDGFEEEVLLSKLCAQTSEEDYEKTYGRIDISIERKEFVTEKAQSKKNLKRIVLEVDLHIHQLTSSIRNMTNHDMVLLQLKKVKQSLKNIDRHKYSKIVFIHGVGSGKLRNEIESVLRKNKMQYQDASFEKYGAGALEVVL